MATTLATVLVLSSLIFHTTSESPKCQYSRCPGAVLPSISFPFRLNESQPDRCGYPGFDLACNKQNQTILSMPTSGDFAVKSIDYWHGVVRVNDPENCMPRRFLVNFVVDFPFHFDDYYVRSYTFLNCTANTTYSSHFKAYPCLSGSGYTVGAVLTELYVHVPTCRVINTVSVPMPFAYTSSLGLYADVSLTWNNPDCRICVRDGGSCGLKGRSGLEIECSLPGDSKKGLSKTAKYGVIIGFGVLASLIFSGLSLHFSGRAATTPNNNTIAPLTHQTNSAIVTIGMSKLAIESYPRLTVGDTDSDKLLANSGDNSCSICLCEYILKEEVRMIPDCSHYFHVNCIDGWLERNATCPLCRKSPSGMLLLVSQSSSTMTQP